MKSTPLTALTKEELDRNLRALQRDDSTRQELSRLQQLVQELQVHQIELEMNNRALREAQAELEHSAHLYLDLYDNLPLAYLTVNASGLIRQANRAAHEWLNPDKRALVGQ